MRKGRLSREKRAEFIVVLNALPIHIDAATASGAFGAILDIADVHRLTAYDAAYLELAMRLKLPLATLDRELRAAATTAGVVLP